MLGDLSGRDARRHLARRARARRRWPARWSSRRVSILSRRHGLSRGRRSRRRLGAARHRGGSRRLPVRGARQRRAALVLDEMPPTARRGADASGGTRGRRSAGRSRGAIGSRRPPRGWRRASTWRRSGRPPDRCIGSTCRSRSIDAERNRRRSGARRSLRQSHHQHRPATFETLGGAGRSTIHIGRAPRSPGWCRRTPTSPPGELCALFGSSDHLEIAAQRRERGRARSAAAAARPCTSRRPCVIAFAVSRLTASDRPDLMISLDLTRTAPARAVGSRVGRARDRAAHQGGRSPAPLRSRARARRDGEARPARHLGAAGVRRRRHGLHLPRARQRGARVRRHLAARDHVGARRPELPDAADVGHRRSEAALSGAAGAGQEDCRLRPDRARRRQRRRAIQTTAVKKGDRYVLNGEKSGSRSPTSPTTSWSSPGPISRRRSSAIPPA